MNPFPRHVAVLRTLLAAVLVAAASLALAVPADANVGTVHTSFQASALSGANGAHITCPTWSAGSDRAGNLYIPCDDAILVVGNDGAVVRRIQLPAGLGALRDAAASADGKYVYWVNGNIRLDNVTDRRAIEPKVGSIQRMVRGNDGAYRHDAGWQVPAVNYGASWWSFRNMAVDGYGNVYGTNNEYVREYTPTGAFRSYFGGSVWTDGQYVGGLEVAQGLDVTPDGKHVFVVEQRWNHVQRWDRSGTTDWVRNGWRVGAAFGYADERGAGCDPDGRTMSSPYDVNLDGGGNLYVLDVTCRRVLKFATTGAFLSVVVSDYRADAPKYHGFVVDYRGTVTVPEQGMRFAYTGAFNGCAPDYNDPYVSSLNYPTSTTSRTVTIRLVARDGCSAVRGLRTTGDLSSTQFWGTYATQRKIILTPGSGTKHVTIHVRDAWGRFGTRTFSIRLTEPPPKVRYRVNLWGQERFCHKNPMSKLHNPSAWRLVDRCAAVVGKVVGYSRSNGNTTLRVRLTLHYTRKIFANASRPVTISVIGNSSTKVGKAIYMGRSVVTTGAIITNSARSVAYMVPTGYWSGR